MPCPDIFPAAPTELLYSSNELEIPQVQCKKCNLRVTTDKNSVIVDCYHCYDISLSGKATVSRKFKLSIYNLNFALYVEQN